MTWLILALLLAADPDSETFGLRVVYQVSDAAEGAPIHLVTKHLVRDFPITLTEARSRAAVIAEQGFTTDERYVPARMVLGVEYLSPCYPEGCVTRTVPVECDGRSSCWIGPSPSTSSPRKRSKR